MEDAELLMKAKEGDTKAFDEVVRRHLPRVYAFLMRYLGDEAFAEDAAQETFIKAWRNIRRFNTEKPLMPWLLRIARNAGNDLLRGKRSTPFSRLFAWRSEDDTPFEETVADDAPLPTELFERREFGEMVQKALKALSERDRAVLILRYEDELSFNDIAEALNVPINTAKSWHHRALVRLRKILMSPAPKRYD